MTRADRRAFWHGPFQAWAGKPGKPGTDPNSASRPISANAAKIAQSSNSVTHPTAKRVQSDPSVGRAIRVTGHRLVP